MGGPLPSGDQTPRAISLTHFRQICPKPTRIRSADVIHDEGESAATRTAIWLEYLRHIDDPCVEIDSSKFTFDYRWGPHCRKMCFNSHYVFIVRIFGSKRLTEIWPTLSKVPILTEFDFSDLIRSAFNTNSGFLGIGPLSIGEMSKVQANQSTGLLVLHIRRGDFSHHCRHLARYSSGFQGFSTFPQLFDQFTPRENPGGQAPSSGQTDVSATFFFVYSHAAKRNCTVLL